MPSAEGKLIGGEAAVLTAEDQRRPVAGQVRGDLGNDFPRRVNLLSVLAVAAGCGNGEFSVGQSLLKGRKGPRRFQEILGGNSKFICLCMVEGAPLHDAKL